MAGSATRRSHRSFDRPRLPFAGVLVITDDAYAEYPLPTGTVLKMIADDGTALIDGSVAGAVDLNTGNSLWTYSDGTGFTDVLNPAPDGGAIVQTAAGTQKVDSTGASPFAGPEQLIDATSVGSDRWIGFSPAGLSKVVSASITDFFFRTDGGYKHGHFASKCQTPPFTSKWKGLPAGSIVLYNFMGDNWGVGQPQSAEEKLRLAVEDAFELWTAANRISGLNTSLVPGPDLATAKLRLRRVFIAPNTNGDLIGGSTSANPDANGFIDGGLITFNTDPAILNNKVGYLKVALHEAGHLFGLGDASGRAGSSVMNQMGKNPSVPGQLGSANDVGGNLATVVTPCDADKARLSPARSWP